MRKRTKRKVWDAGLNPVRLASCRVPPTDADLLSARLAEAQALGALAAGTGNDHDAGVMLVMLRIARRMAADGIGPEAAPALQAASEAMGRLVVTEQGIGLSADDLAHLREARAWHDAQRTGASGADYMRAMLRRTL